MEYFTASMADRGGQSKKVAFLIKKLTEDAIEEAAEVPPEIMELYMQQASAVLYYAATGETILNMPLPDDFVITGEVESTPPRGELE